MPRSSHAAPSRPKPCPVTGDLLSPCPSRALSLTPPLQGHTVGHIKAIGTNASLEGVRPYTTNIPHGYHSDNSDLVGG